MGYPILVGSKQDRPKPKSGVDDADHIYERIQELRREREEVERRKQPFLDPNASTLVVDDVVEDISTPEHWAAVLRWFDRIFEIRE